MSSSKVLSKDVAPSLGAPLFHAASHVIRHYLYEGFSWFVAAYRTAAEKLQRGDPDPHFPIGSFPPPLPFVGG
jgi:hypothetical protein